MKTLLFVQDNIIAPKETLKYVISLAKSLDVKLKFLHVHYPEVLYAINLSPDMHMFQSSEILQEDKAAEMKKIEKVYRELKEENQVDDDTSFEYYSGIPLLLLKEKFDKKEFDMLAFQNPNSFVGVNFYHSLKDILKSISCPIWVVPNKIPYAEVGKVLYASDYQEEDIAAIGQLKDIFGNCLKEVKIVHLTSESGFSQKIQQIGFTELVKEKTGIESVTSLSQDVNEKKTIADIMGDIVKKEDCNVIVTLKENKNLFQKVFYRSFTNKLIKNTKELILVLH